jgi:hypothetical protein
MYVNAVANSVMLQTCLLLDFYNIIFKNKLFIALGSAPFTPLHLQRNIMGACPFYKIFFHKVLRRREGLLPLLLKCSLEYSAGNV